MRIELKNAFGKVFIEVIVDSKNRWVYTNWIGYLTKDNIMAGALAYTEAIKKTGYCCVLNDTSEVLGGWDHSLDWVVNQWGPQAANAGIKHFALITKPESFAGSSAENFYESLKAFQVKVFDNLADAQFWLRQYIVVNQQTNILNPDIL
jgi:hypothetical protein